MLEFDPYFLFVQKVVRSIAPYKLDEAECKRIRVLWVDGETDAQRIIDRVRENRLWER